MSFAWADYYRYRIGLPLAEYHAMPLGMFDDLVCCWMIEHGAKEKLQADDEQMIPDIL